MDYITYPSQSSSEEIFLTFVVHAPNFEWPSNWIFFTQRNEKTFSNLFYKQELTVLAAITEKIQTA